MRRIVEPLQEPITGWMGSSEYFRFREYRGLVPAAVCEVLRGRVLGAVFRRAVTHQTCAAIADRFWASSAGRRRTGEAPVHYIGTYHYHKTTDDYLRQCAETESHLDDILSVVADPLTEFYDGLAEALRGEGVTLRRAQHCGRLAARGIARSWLGHGDFALEPHEDRSQCTEPGQGDFEIQQVVAYQICGLNVCIENGGGGRLVIWNIQPDAESKKRYGTSFSGSPYSVISLKDVNVSRLNVQPGDIYVFNSSHVHAVEPSVQPSDRRTTLSGFLGFIDNSTVVSWT